MHSVRRGGGSHVSLCRSSYVQSGGRSALRNRLFLLTLSLAGAACDDGWPARAAQGSLISDSSRVDFGALTLGLSTERSVGLVQRGILPAEVEAVSLLPDEGAFVVQPLPDTIDRDSSAVLSVAFRPTTAGTHRTQLEVRLLHGDPVTIELEGRGVDARATPQNAIDFGRPALGTVRHRALVLRNDFETGVPITLRVVGPDAADFRITDALWVTPSGEATADVRYEPLTRPGRRDASIEFVACPLCAPQLLPIAADAVPSPLEIAPDPLDLGSVQIDAERVGTVRITNAIDEMITLTAIEPSGDTDPGFDIEAAPAPVFLAPLDTLDVTVRFSPTRLGTADGTLVVRSDTDGALERRIALRARGGGSQLVVTPGRIDFRQVPSGGRAQQVVTIGNGGADPAAPPLRVLGVGVSGAPFLVEGVQAGLALGAGERVEAVVAFEPTSEGVFLGELRIESDDPATPEAKVFLSGTGGAVADCVLVATPPELDFGGLHDGRGALLAVRVTNVGTEGCTLWNGRVEGDPSLTLHRERAFVQLGAGDSVVAPVAFRPTGAGQFEAVLRFDTNEALRPLFEVPISGSSGAMCLRPEPGFLAFGPRRLDCGPSEQIAIWRNACSGPIEVQSLELGAGTDDNAFEVVDQSPVPATLPPGGTVQARVRYTPSLVGFSASPLWAQGSDSPLPTLFTVSVDARAEALHDETYVQPAPARLDMLWVIDNTASMKDERASLSQSIASFLAQADARGIDYQIGVTTTGIGEPPGGPTGQTCSGGAEGAESGRLFPVDGSRPRIVTPATPDRAGVLAANVDVGGCHSVEQGLEAARLALSPPLIDNADDGRTPQPNDGNKGLLREDAALAVIVVSDEDDGSPGEVADLVRRLRRTKPSSPMSLNAIVAPPGGCAGAVEPGLRYIEAVQAIGGVVASVCESDWSASLTGLADDLFKPRRQYVLAAPAEPGSLVVTADGLPASGWTYDPATHSVSFAAPPTPGTRLRFQYREPCPAP